eukprot:3117355-Prymnesium_polylepis.1
MRNLGCGHRRSRAARPDQHAHPLPVERIAREVQRFRQGSGVVALFVAKCEVKLRSRQQPVGNAVALVVDFAQRLIHPDQRHPCDARKPCGSALEQGEQDPEPYHRNSALVTSRRCWSLAGAQRGICKEDEDDRSSPEQPGCTELAHLATLRSGDGSLRSQRSSRGRHHAIATVASQRAPGRAPG